MNEAVCKELVRIARAASLTTYGEIAPLAGLTMVNPAHRARMASILEEICTYEQAHGRPMLSALVVRKDTNMPGKGFFRLARQLGLYEGNDDEQFFNERLARVYDTWAHMPYRARGPRLLAQTGWRSRSGPASLKGRRTRSRR